MEPRGQCREVGRCQCSSSLQVRRDPSGLFGAAGVSSTVGGASPSSGICSSLVERANRARGQQVGERAGAGLLGGCERLLRPVSPLEQTDDDVVGVLVNVAEPTAEKIHR